ncbi:hypothetical protein [Cupriavidus necator]|uniref:hypothetical protein n=1 Tax=Cupriavidus necator TaxID=106590 RepID=UPI00339D2F86
MSHLGIWDVCRDGNRNIPYATRGEATKAGWEAACAESVDLYVHWLDGTMHRYDPQIRGNNPDGDEE